jgi:hypothetical protein
MYDFGPYGVELVNNIKSAWWKSNVHLKENYVGLDSAMFKDPRVWVASGHVGGFADPLAECKKCNTRIRVDKELEKIGVSREEAMERVLGAILEFWGPKGIIVFGAHNAAFDMAFLQEQILKPAGVTLEFHQAKLDTAVLGMMLFGNGRSDFVFELLAGCDGRGAHNSLDDARFCLKSMRTAKQLFQEIFNE